MEIFMMKDNICILTGQKVEFEPSGLDNTHYGLVVAGVHKDIFLCNTCVRDIKFPIPHHIIRGLIANGKWPDRSYIVTNSHTDKMPPTDSETLVLPDYLLTLPYPKSPADKLNHLFLSLFDKQHIDGDILEIEVGDENIWCKNYFRSPEECMFYLDALHKSGLLVYYPDQRISMKGSVQITIEGLQKAVNLKGSGIESKNCFIAMAFNENTTEAREAIKLAVKKAGYTPILIDEQNLESDKTIPDSIIAAIKQCKFCVADFSFHKNGVYFESGYALGLGKQVIYTCSESQFNEAHFDIKQLQHIIYKNPKELEERLRDKILAWI